MYTCTCMSILYQVDQCFAWPTLSKDYPIRGYKIDKFQWSFFFHIFIIFFFALLLVWVTLSVVIKIIIIINK